MSDSISQPAGLLLLPRLCVQNANAISGPLTWGFPGPMAFLGFVHALERRLFAEYGQLLEGVGIICHRFEPQVFKPNRRRHVVFTQSRNPVYLKRDAAKFIAEGTPAAIVEEGRAHLEISLLITLKHDFAEDMEAQQFARKAYQVAQGMRMAGGSFIPGCKPREPLWLAWPGVKEEQRKVFSRLRRRLLPGFALVHRPDLLQERLSCLQEWGQASATALDALLDLTRLNYSPVVQEGDQASESSAVTWELEKRPGWLVPLPVGYAGISELYPAGEVIGARDSETPFRFVESLYSLGEWVSPHRMSCLEDLLWHSTASPEAGLYRCVNPYAENIAQTEPDFLKESDDD